MSLLESFNNDDGDGKGNGNENVSIKLNLNFWNFVAMTPVRLQWPMDKVPGSWVLEGRTQFRKIKNI